MSGGRADLLDALAAIVDYPLTHPAPHVRAGLAALAAVSADAAAALGRFADAIAGTPLVRLQEQYTATFDLDPECALDLGWHLFGDAHERGAFLAALAEDLARLDAPETAELPDHLTRVLALVGRAEPASAAALVGLVAPAVDAVQRALVARASPYADAVGAIRAVLAGIGAEAAPEVA